MRKAAVAELVFIPSPGIGHLVSTVELVKVLVNRDECVCVTVLVMDLNLMESDNSTLNAFIQSSSALTRIRFIQLPPAPQSFTHDTGKGPFLSLLSCIERLKPQVREAVSGGKYEDPQSPKLAGFVVDMFCTSMIDIAEEFGVPSYVFYTSSASFLGVTYHLLDLEEQHSKPIGQIITSHSEIDFPGFQNPLPAKQLPREMLDPHISPYFLGLTKRYRTETKGILVNSFMELESRVMQTVFDATSPPIYLVGPLLSLNNDDHGGGRGGGAHHILKWLDQQPPASVVFLCFGSRGAFDDQQVTEMAVALERSGARFLWSLRRPPQEGKFEMPTEYASLEEALPEGFLDRTASVGKVIGWAPQAQVLAHTAVGGFVTHCGWNSTLESIWFGVPTAAWPVYAEQQFNAFVTVKELGTAVEVQMDYKQGESTTVGAEKIQGAIRQLMEGERQERRRTKTKQLSESSRRALEVDGSSYNDLGRFLSHVFHNINLS